MQLRCEGSWIDIGEKIHWAQAFRVLAVHRMIPLWTEVGVPAEVTRYPEPVMRIARDYLHAERKVGDRQVLLLNLLEDTFRQISDEYGSDVANRLYSWARRHLVDRDESNLWDHWGAILVAMEDYIDQGHVDASAEPDAVRRFFDAMRKQFDPHREDRDEETIAHAHTVALSTEERELLAFKPEASGQVTDLDPLPTIELLIDSFRAFQVWTQLSNQVSPEDREQILRWVQAEAARLRIGWEVGELPLPAEPRAAESDASPP